jgi:pimeloyl-ACP methyl ester carboxylesterase
MPHVVSRDRTRIAYERQGRGAPLIFVDGALCHRKMGPAAAMAARLAPHFTVFTYDRRGRGESGDTAPYAVDREVEDLQALIAEAGGDVSLFGVSSGAVLAVETASRTPAVRRLATYEAPFVVDASHGAFDDDWRRIDSAVAAGRPGDAVRIFLRSVGMPGFMVNVMRLTPVWKKLAATGTTLPYDGAIMREYQQGKPLPSRRWSSVRMPTLVMDGGKSPTWMRNGQRAFANVLPNASYRTLPGQTHMVKADIQAPVLLEFFKA